METVWHLAHGRKLPIGKSAKLMGILNVTPDSFSDGGRFGNTEKAIEQGHRMIREGATIIDIGGESTRPGASAISAGEEQERVLPVIRQLASETDAILSIDTYRSETAALAVEAGAHIVNDVWGLQRDPKIAEIAANTGAGLVIMHTGRERQKLDDVIDDQKLFLKRSLEIAKKTGVLREQIMLDPGFGFAKDVGENLELIARFAELHELGYPLLAGTSRKRFIGAVTGREGDLRDRGTAATTVILMLKGAAILRVHDVAMNMDALRITDAVLEYQNRSPENQGVGKP